MIEATQPERRTVPTVVRAASWLLFVLAALQVLSAVLAVVAIGPTIDAMRDYLTESGNSDKLDALVVTARISSFGAVAVAVLFAIGYVVLALFLLRGVRAARIVTWVLAGLSLCCLAGGLAGNALQGLGGQQVNGFDQEEMARRIEAALPGWLSTASTALNVLGILLILTVAILLALPAANAFFRKPQGPQAQWEPPLPGYGGAPAPAPWGTDPSVGQSPYAPGQPAGTFPPLAQPPAPPSAPPATPTPPTPPTPPRDPDQER
jgi:hypothetical protein